MTMRGNTFAESVAHANYEESKPILAHVSVVIEYPDVFTKVPSLSLLPRDRVIY